MGCFKNIFGSGRLAFAFAAVCALAFFAGCSNTSSTDSAGILIETNTGNKGVARICVAPELWDLSAGDTVSLAFANRDTVGDTVFVYESDYRKVVDSSAVLSGMFDMDSVPVGKYDSVTIYGLDGERSYVVDVDVEDGEKKKKD